MRTRFHSGPEQGESDPNLGLVIPNPVINSELTVMCGTSEVLGKLGEHVVQVEKFSSLSNLVRVVRLVMVAIKKLKRRCGFLEQDSHSEPTLEDASNALIIADQATYFPEVVNYFLSKKPNLSDIPKLVKQLNV